MPVITNIITNTIQIFSFGVQQSDDPINYHINLRLNTKQFRTLGHFFLRSTSGRRCNNMIPLVFFKNYNVFHSGHNRSPNNWNTVLFSFSSCSPLILLEPCTNRGYTKYRTKYNRYHPYKPSHQIPNNQRLDMITGCTKYHTNYNLYHVHMCSHSSPSISNFVLCGI